MRRMQDVLDTEECEFRTGRYANGNLSLNMIDRDGNPLAELSLEAPGVAQSPDEIILKIYGENQEIAARLLTAKILTQTPRHIFVGGAFCPVCKVAILYAWRIRISVSEEEIPEPLTQLPRAGAATYPPGQSRDSR